MPAPVITMLREEPLPGYASRPQVTAPEEAYALILPYMTDLDREIGLVISLDTQHRLLAVDTVSVGSVDHTFFAPREVFRTALQRGASALFIAHNHPSGNPTPSADDRSITIRLHQAGATMGIDVLDHLVIGDASFTSLARLGVL